MWVWPAMRRRCSRTSDLPLIDSARAGLNVILKGLAPLALSPENRFHTLWSNVHLSTDA